MVLNLTRSWLRRKWLLQFCLDAADYLGIFLPEDQLRGPEAVWDHSNLQLVGSVIQRGAPITPPSVHPETLKDECTL
jgi:hypothetical protein